MTILMLKSNTKEFLFLVIFFTLKIMYILLLLLLLSIPTCFAQLSEEQLDLSNQTLKLTHQKVSYDGSYFSIDYPNGDVPKDKGVCTVVVIRAYRKIGIDLQKKVHEDMKTNFQAYPNNWGLKATDTNIDHRRVPNLMTFFKREGAEKSISNHADDYLPGDIVSWELDSGLLHIGIVVNKKSTDGKRNLMVHNIGSGQVLADCLFSYKIIKHYRYFGN